MLNAVLSIVLIVSFAVSGRAHGAATHDEQTGKPTGWPTWGRTAALVYVSLVMGYVNFHLFGLYWLAVVSCLVTAYGFSTGHGNVYAMLGVDKDNDQREQLEYIFRPLYRGSIYTPAYSWYIMGIKGAIVALPAFPFGLVMYFLWPLSYSLSFRKTNDSAPAEWLSLGFTGAIAAVTLWI